MVLPKENVTGRNMAVDEKMSVDERYKYLSMMQKRYQKANPKGKSELLDQLFALPNAPDGSTQDVYLTLFNPPEFLKGDDSPLSPVTFSYDRTTLLR